MEMIDGGAATALIGREATVALRSDFGIVDLPLPTAAIGERASYADGAQRIEAIGILDYLPLQARHRCGHLRSLEGQRADDVANLLDHLSFQTTLLEPCSRCPRTGFQVTIVELPVGNIVQQRRQFHDEEIRSFFLTQPAREHPDPIDVPPVVASGLAGEPISYEVSSAFDDITRRSMFSDAGAGLVPTREGARPSPTQPLVSCQERGRNGVRGVRTLPVP